MPITLVAVQPSAPTAWRRRHAPSTSSGETLEDHISSEWAILRGRCGGATARANAAWRSRPDCRGLPGVGTGFSVRGGAWPEEWVAPSERQAAKWFDQTMQCISRSPRTMPSQLRSPFSADGPASISVRNAPERHLRCRLGGVRPTRGSGSIGPRRTHSASCRCAPGSQQIRATAAAAGNLRDAVVIGDDDRKSSPAPATVNSPRYSWLLRS